MDTRIRQAGLDELDKVVPLFDNYRIFYGQDSDVEAARQFLLSRMAHGESVILLAWRGRQTLGFCQLYPSFSSTSMTRTFILNDLYVDARARRQGVASLLLEAAADYAARLGATGLALSTAVDNHSAQALYEKHGWQRDLQFFGYELALVANAD